MIYILHQEQILPASLERVWDYFATPRNLNEMTPPDMAFEFIAGGDEPMYAGQMIAYRIAILPGVRVRWLTQITHVEPGRMFIDEQRIGPYRLWIHEHRFEPVEGGTRMTDHVTYALPFSPAGDVLAFYIRRRLDRIFAYRRQQGAALFKSASTTRPDLPRKSHRAPQSSRNLLR